MKNKMLNVIIIILVIISVGLTGYVIYDKILNNQNKESNNTDDNYEKIGKELFEKYGNYVYSSENLNYRKLSNKIKLEMALVKSK